MTRLNFLLRTAASLSAVLLVSTAAIPCSAQHETQNPIQSAAQTGGESASLGTLTVERVAAEPDLGPQTRAEAVQQAPLLHWSPDAARVAWLHLVPPPAHSPVRAPQQEIWSLAAEAAQSSSPASSQASAQTPHLLVSAQKVTASLRGTETPRPLSIDEDDNSNPDLLRDFAWFPGHESLLLVSGESLARLDVASGKSSILLSGEQQLSDVAISPDGRTISFVRGHNVWTIGAAGGSPRPLTHATKPDVLAGEADWPYRNELHLQHAYAWSPDSTRVAWLETDDSAVEKYTLRLSNGSSHQIISPKPGGALPVVRIFIQRVGGASLPLAIKLPANADSAKGYYLPRFTWLPDGRHLAIQRLDRRQQTLELFLADVVTGKTQLVLTEKDKYWINLSNDLIFLKDSKRFVWSSERTGFRHLYLYDTEGKQLAQLTHGDWEVTELNAVDEAGSRVYFTAVEKGPLERHLYSVSLTGEDLTQISRQPGTHEAHFAPGAGAYLDSFSSHTTPPTLALVNPAARNPALTNPASTSPESSEQATPFTDTAPPNLQPVEFLTLKLHMGAEAHAFMIKPPAFDPTKKYPVILYLAGGPGEQLVRDAWGGATGLWMQLMAQKGYILFALDNQGTAARGHYFEEPLHFRLAAQEMIDQRDGLAYLLDLPYVDPARLGVCGSGYGGFLAIHAMLDRPIAYKAGFAAAPVVDWHFYNAVFAERYLDDPVAHQDGWLSSTAFENAKYFKGPLLVAQGTVDEYVHMENLLTLQDSLLDNGKSADVLLLPDRGHIIDDTPTRIVLFRRMTDFFTKNL